MEEFMEDARDEILAWLKSEERSLAWLAKKTGIKYHTLYSIIVQRTFDLSQDNLREINRCTNQSFQ